MRHPFIIKPQKQHPMINKVSYQVIARKEKKTSDQTVPICLNAFINKQRVVIPLSMKVPLKYWDAKKRCVKTSCPEATFWNADISTVRINVASIITEANARNVKLTRESFRAKLESAISNVDFIQYAFDELDARKGEIKHRTYLQQKSHLAKLKRFKSLIPFSELQASTIKDYERWLYKKGNKVNTVWSALKTFKTYVNLSLMRGFEYPNPFDGYEIKKGYSKKVFLTIPELHKLLEMHDKKEVPEKMRISLLVFLVECFTSLRISDAKQISSDWINDGELSFMPTKTSAIQKTVRFKPSQIAMRLLIELFQEKARTPIKAEQKINDDLKLIAYYAKINKNITNHVGRHTFATTYLTLQGTERGTVQALQHILAHSSIETTMVYVHLVDETINEQIKNFDNEFK